MLSGTERSPTICLSSTSRKPSTLNSDRRATQDHPKTKGMAKTLGYISVPNSDHLAHNNPTLLPPTATSANNTSPSVRRTGDYTSPTSANPTTPSTSEPQLPTFPPKRKFLGDRPPLRSRMRRSKSRRRPDRSRAGRPKLTP